jgi:hypothetical protein
LAEQDINSRRSEALFTGLILSFQTAAMQQMGKIKNPFTDKIEREMQQARYSIDMLGMLQEKTKGNLNENESKLIGQVLHELRMNFIDELKKDQGGEQQKGPEENVTDQQKDD